MTRLKWLTWRKRECTRPTTSWVKLDCFQDRKKLAKISMLSKLVVNSAQHTYKATRSKHPHKPSLTLSRGRWTPCLHLTQGWNYIWLSMQLRTIEMNLYFLFRNVPQTLHIIYRKQAGVLWQNISCQTWVMNYVDKHPRQKMSSKWQHGQNPSQIAKVGSTCGERLRQVGGWAGQCGGWSKKNRRLFWFGGLLIKK